jgi:hypothetical protein
MTGKGRLGARALVAVAVVAGGRAKMKRKISPTRVMAPPGEFAWRP